MKDPFASISDMVLEAERHADDLANDRVDAVEYYKGVMKDTPSDAGRSSITTRDVRANIKKVLPSVVRTILGTDEVVEFQPKQPEDEEGAKQASDYINYVVLSESGAKDAIYDAIHDALLLRNGILKWWFEEKKTVKITNHSGIDENELAQIAGGEGVEVVEASERVEMVEDQPVNVFDVKIRREVMQRDIKTAAVPRERLLIHPDAISFEDSLLVGEKTQIRRSDLVAMGYDQEVIRGLGLAEEDDYEEDTRRDSSIGDVDEPLKANELVDYYDLFIRVDLDNDGISELRHMCFAGGLKEKNLLVDDECDEVQFADIAVMRQPHQWEALSLADDLMDLQQVKTVLLRGTADNLYWQNNRQPVIQDGAISNPDAVYNPEFGQAIRVKKGFNVKDAYMMQDVPFTAAESFNMMEYIDREAQDRTGVSDASSGLAPEALQNMTATASAMIEQTGIGQTELMVRTAAEGLQRFFKGLLRLAIRHQDKPRTVRLRNEWVSFDPRHWNADMDVTVNTGLGAGTRERDMMMMQQVLGIQERIIAQMGPDNPYVKPDNLGNSLTKLVEAAGLKTPGMYFHEPDEQEVAQFMEQLQNQPNPEMMKLQAEQQSKQADVQIQMQMKQMEMQANRDKEMAQMEADLTVAEADRAAKAEQIRMELEADALKEGQKLQFEREQLAAEQQIKREEMAVNVQLEAIRASAPKEGDSGGQEQALMALAESMASFASSASAPKRVVRDDAGNVVGLEAMN